MADDVINQLFTCYFFKAEKYDKGSYNLSSCKTRTSVFHRANIMAADDMATPRSKGINNHDIDLIKRITRSPNPKGLN